MSHPHASSLRLAAWLCSAVVGTSMVSAAQAPPGPPATPAPRPVVSPEVGADRRVTFRVAAVDAQQVELRSPGDIPGINFPGRGPATPLAKNADGVWEVTIGPVPSGAYRYA